MTRKLTHYEATCLVEEVEKEVAEMYEVDRDYYGDCWSYEVLELSNKLTFASDEEVQEIREEIKTIFESYAKTYKLEKLEEERFVLWMKDRWSSEDWDLERELIEKIKELSGRVSVLPAD